MKKEDYFLACMKAGSYKHKAWVLKAFAVTKLPNESDYGTPKYPYELFTDGKYYCFKDPDNGSTVVLEEAVIKEPLFDFKKGIDITPDDVPTLEKRARVSYGTLLFNYVTLISTVGRKIPFQMGKCDVSAIEKLIVAKLADDVDDPKDEKDDVIYVRELLKYVEHAVEISGYSQLCVPSASPRTMVSAPGYRELYSRLLKEYQGQLHDPAVVAKIGDELEKLDREWIAGDTNKGFYQKAKSFEVTRKKMFYMFGVEKNFSDDGFTFIPEPLQDGWNLDNFPAMVSSLRDGSYSRGAMTALGGEKTKGIFRVTSGSQITVDDCGSTVGTPFTFSKSMLKQWDSCTVIVDGKQIKIGSDTIDGLVGKVGLLRHPGYCQVGDNNYCATCVGTFIEDREHAIPSLTAEVGSILMYMMMKAMHGKSLKIAQFELKNLLC